MKFLRNSFDVIETIDSDDEFDPFEATTEGGNSLDDSILRERLPTEKNANYALVRNEKWSNMTAHLEE